jgi:phosphate transport system substrate-binding protein
MLASVDSKTRQEGEEGNLSRKTITLLGVLAATVAIVLSGITGAAQARPQATELTGAGSSFVAPLVAAWTAKVEGALALKITYGPIGSGGGINAITNRTVDFGASDAPLTPDQFAACKGCVQIPWALSATAIAYKGDNLPNHVHLTGAVLASIFEGRVTNWSDPQIKKLNKGKSLPDLKITVIHRSDNSGTTYNLTDYLSHVSPSWKNAQGKGVAVNWPTGIGARGSSGVAAALSSTQGGITYVDVAYTLANHLKFAAVKNKAGVYALPGLTGIKSAAATINRVAPDNGGISIVNPAKTQKLAYPICTFTYVIIPKQTSKAAELKRFVNWALTKGQASGPKLLFSPIPKVVLRASLKTTALIHS